MPKTYISKSIIIDAEKSKIKEFLADLHNWKPWSPWLICEPEVKLDIKEDGKFYTWEGKRVGSGSIEVLNESENKIEYDLKFLTPWKSNPKTEFNFSETEKGTKVEWIMRGSLPFFMFWMKTKMEAWVGMDYERGLKMLKEHLETGTVQSKIEILGTQEFSGFEYVGIKRSTQFKNIGQDMTSDFGALEQLVVEQDLELDGVPFSQYHKFDLVSGRVDYTAGIPVKNAPKSLPNPFIKNALKSAKFSTVRHTGYYEHLGNAWSTSQMMLRNKEFKPIKAYHPLEFYINNPKETEAKDLITDIHFACK